MEPIQHDDLDEEVTQKIHFVHRAIFKVTEKECRRHGISRQQVAPIFVLAALGGRCTRAQLTRYLFREPHTISELVGRMEARGILRRVDNPDRVNGVIIELSDKGWDVYHKVSERRSSQHILSVLTEEEKNEMSRLLSRLWDSALEELKPKKRKAAREVSGRPRHSR